MTPEQARAELARRELARRELAKRNSSNPKVVEESAQHGGISETPGIIEKLGRNLTQKETRPLGLLGGVGVGMSAAGIPEEEALPMAGQMVGSMASGFPGAGILGAAGGASVGQLVEQSLKPLRGKQSDFKEVPMEALRTGALEGLTRGTGKFVFRRQIANDTLKGLNAQLGRMKEEMIANPNLSASSQPILDVLETAYNASPDPVKRGQASQVVRRWIAHMKSKPNLSADDIITMERDLGEAANYGSFKKGVFQPPNVPNPRMNEVAKAGRTVASDEVEKMSAGAGQKGFGEVSKKISKLLNKYPDFDPSKSGSGFGTRVATSLGVGLGSNSPIAGILTYLGVKASQSPTLRNQMYGVIKNPVAKTAGKSLKALIGESLRKRD
jgi:hypothetical protein